MSNNSANSDPLLIESKLGQNESPNSYERFVNNAYDFSVDSLLLGALASADVASESISPQDQQLKDLKQDFISFLTSSPILYPLQDLPYNRNDLTDKRIDFLLQLTKTHIVNNPEMEAFYTRICDSQFTSSLTKTIAKDLFAGSIAANLAEVGMGIGLEATLGHGIGAMYLGVQYGSIVFAPWMVGVANVIRGGYLMTVGVKRGLENGTDTKSRIRNVAFNIPAAIAAGYIDIGWAAIPVISTLYALGPNHMVIPTLQRGFAVKNALNSLITSYDTPETDNTLKTFLDMTIAKLRRIYSHNTSNA